VGWYLRSLEQVLIDLLADYGLSGERLQGFTGVWVGGAKVAAIGVGIHQWVTFHGLALNVNPDMRHWGCIIPCGIADKPVTSLAGLLGSAPPMVEVMDRFEGHFRRVFG
jgi:lipoyl(octanoyl) transferase